jgi:transposase-like protein
MVLNQPQVQTVEAARLHLQNALWADGPVCPHCGVIGEATELQAKAAGRRRGQDVTFDTHARPRVYQCNGCRKQFTVTVGTIFEDSHIPLHKWLMAIHLMCSSKKGMSALQIQRELWGEDPDSKDKHGRPRLKGSYRTAWFMCHRIRWAMTQSPMAEAVIQKLSCRFESGQPHHRNGVQ